MPSHYWISAPLRAERDRLRAGLALPPLLAVVSAHHHPRGPYTAVGTLLRLIGPDVLRRRPDLATRHRIELRETTPEPADLVPAILRPLENSAKGPVAVSRYPARLHSLRVSHGLVDFLDRHLTDLGGGPRTLVVEDAHHADATDREFLAVLLRRMPAELLTVVVTTGTDAPAELPGPPSASLPQALLAHTERVTGPTALPQAGVQRDTGQLARVCVESDGTDVEAVPAAGEDEYAHAHDDSCLRAGV